MKGGESIKSKIQDEELIAHGNRVADTAGIVGPANVQCSREPDSWLPVTDVNPRFGGGFPAPTRSRVSRYPELSTPARRGQTARAPPRRLGPPGRRRGMTHFFSHLLHNLRARR